MKVLLVAAGSARSPSFGFRMGAAFERAGHEVKHFDYRKFQLHRFGFGRRFLSNRLVAKCKATKPDLVFVGQGETLLPGTIKKIKALGIKTACWVTDAPFGGKKFACIPEYTAFFVFDRSYLPQLKKINKNSFWLPCCVDSSLYREVIPVYERKEPFTASFFGSQYPNRQVFFSKLADLDIHLWGFRWANKTEGTPLHQRVHNETLHVERSNADVTRACELFNESKINLNVHFTHSIASPNQRAFEIPATNSFQLSDWLPDLETLFVPNKEIVLFKTPEECRKLIAYYADRPADRHKIALAGMKRVLKEHTFDHRIREALTILKKVKP